MKFKTFYDSREEAMDAVREAGYAMWRHANDILATIDGRVYVLTVHRSTGYADWRSLKEVD